MLIYETVLTTKRGDKMNIAPMGVHVVNEKTLLVFPFKTSHTYRLLKDTGVAVVNFVDNVEIIARTVLSDEIFPWDPAEKVDGWVLRDAYMYFEVKSKNIKEDDLKACFEMEVLLKRERRVPLIFNRASFAVIEGAIILSRLSLYEKEEVVNFFKMLQSLVFKTGGERELRAWNFLIDFLRGEGIL